MTTETNSQRLPREAQWLLAELWKQVAECDEKEISDRQLRMVARLVGICSRKAGVQASELIIAVKESWMAHPDLRPNDRQRLGWVLNEVISSSIDEFFRVLSTSEVEQVRPDERPWRPVLERVTAIPHERSSD